MDGVQEILGPSDDVPTAEMLQQVVNSAAQSISSQQILVQQLQQMQQMMLTMQSQLTAISAIQNVQPAPTFTLTYQG